MARKNIPLAQAAEAFKVHPRTILRALSQQQNPYWTEDINDDPISIEKLAEAYGTTVHFLNRVFDERDEILTVSEAALILGVSDRALRRRRTSKKTPTIRTLSHGGVVRFVKSQIIALALPE